MAQKSKYNLSVDSVLFEKGKVYPDSILEDGKLSPEDFEEVSNDLLEVVSEDATTEDGSEDEDAPKKPTRKSSKKTPKGSLE